MELSFKGFSSSKLYSVFILYIPSIYAFKHVYIFFGLLFLKMRKDKLFGILNNILQYFTIGYILNIFPQKCDYILR